MIDKCPKCNEKSLEYRTTSKLGEFIFTTFLCKKCGALIQTDSYGNVQVVNLR